MKIFFYLYIIIIILFCVEYINCSSNVTCSTNNLILVRDELNCTCLNWRDITNGLKLFCPEIGVKIQYESQSFPSKNYLTTSGTICGCSETNLNCPELEFRFASPSFDDTLNKTKEVLDKIPKIEDKDLCIPVTKQYDEGHLLNPKKLKLLKKSRITKKIIAEIDAKQLQCSYELSINITDGSISHDGKNIIIYKQNYFLPGEYAVVNYVHQYEPYGPQRTYKLEYHHVPDYIRGCISNEPRYMEKTKNFMVVSVVNDDCISYWIKTGNHSYETNLLSVLGQNELKGKLYPTNDTRWIFYKNNSQQPTCERLKEKFYDSKNIIYIILSILSVILGISALLIYSTLNKFKEVHGCVLMCYLFGLVIMEIMETVAAFDPSLIYFTRFSFTTISFCEFHSYAWLNVLCYDTYTNLTSMTVNRNSFGKFIKYLVYVFVCTITFTLIGGFLFNSWNPVYRQEGDYWFGIISFIPEMPLFTFYVVSLALLSLPNVGFFTVTSIYIYKTQQAVVHKIQSDSPHKKIKEQFLLHLRLFTLMGLHVFIYAMELIFFLEWKKVRRVIDFYNRAQGILIFFIFIWRRQIREQIAKRYFKSIIFMRSAKIAPESTSSTSV